MEDVWDSAEPWRLTLEHSPIGTAVVGLDARIQWLNPALCDLLGRDGDDLLGRCWGEIARRDDADGTAELIDRVTRGELDRHRWTTRLLHLDGPGIWVEVSVAVVRDRDGRPIHLVAQVIDVNDQRERHSRLEVAGAEAVSEQQILAAIFETVPVGLLLIDNDGRYVRMNRRHRESMSLPFPDGHRGQAGQLGEVYYLDGRTLMAREDMPSYRATQGEEFDDYAFWVGADPRTRAAFSVSARQVRGPTGDKLGSALAYQEITDLMRARLTQDEFVSSVSHELRTPLTAMLGYLEMMGEDPGVPAEVVAQLKIVERNALRLRSLLSDLLQVGQLEEGSFSLHLELTDLVGLVQEAVEVSQPMADQHGVAVETSGPEHLMAVVDRQRMRQVLDNLISNGIKYTRAGGRVGVEVRQGAQSLELDVTDTGIGIAPGETEHVFDRFFRSDAVDQRIPGTGLGLNIVRSIVLAHHGRVTLESELGKGSTFRVTLPT